MVVIFKVYFSIYIIFCFELCIKLKTDCSFFSRRDQDQFDLQLNEII